ncbi:MAG TPA: zf-HC2 domain-containing protein [Solirubrobacteraceae bacterium]|nr:zf-HC2 domain-containing protein [Solirubrobacteraceae bacterium]
MSSCDEHRPLLGGYVLEALEPDEAAAVREHLRTCLACSAEHASLAGLPALLDLTAGLDQPSEQLPPAFEEALLDRFARDRGGRPPRRRLPSLAWRVPRVAVVSAIIAAALGAGTVALLKDGGSAVPPGGWDGSYVVPLRATAAAPRATARVALARVRGGTSIHLWARGLPRGPGQVYEMRCEGEHLRASAGTFRADAQGRVEVRLTTAARVGEYDRVRIVRQAAAGIGEEVLAGRLF